MVDTFFEEIRFALQRGGQRQAVGFRQLPVARQARSDPGRNPEDRRGHPDHTARTRRDVPREPEAQGDRRERSTPGT